MTRKRQADEKPKQPVMIRVSRGLCSAARDEVYTALTDYGIEVLNITAWGEGHWHIECPDDRIFPDADPWVKKHIVDVTVFDSQAEWAERLLWQTNKFNLETLPLVPTLTWKAPKDCKAGARGRLGRGTMPQPWSASEGKRQRRPKRQTRTTRRTRRAQRDEGSVLGTLKEWLK